eukprot:4361722-Alexandrium_andersonii.AAC.1
MAGSGARRDRGSLARSVRACSGSNLRFVAIRSCFALLYEPGDAPDRAQNCSASSFRSGCARFLVRPLWCVDCVVRLKTLQSGSALGVRSSCGDCPARFGAAPQKTAISDID